MEWIKTTFGELKAGDVATKEEQDAKDFVNYWNKKEVCYIYGLAYFIRTPFPCDETDRNTPVWKIVFPTLVSPEREALERIRRMAMDSGNVLGARMAGIYTIATAALALLQAEKGRGK